MSLSERRVPVSSRVRWRPHNTGLVSDCDTLLSARDTLEGSAELNWSAGTPMESWEGVSLGGTPARVTGIVLADRGLSGRDTQRTG